MDTILFVIVTILVLSLIPAKGSGGKSYSRGSRSSKVLPWFNRRRKRY